MKLKLFRKLILLHFSILAIGCDSTISKLVQSITRTRSPVASDESSVRKFDVRIDNIGTLTNPIEGEQVNLSITIDPIRESETSLLITLNSLTPSGYSRFQNVPTEVKIPGGASKASISLQSVDDSIYQGSAESFELRLKSSEQKVETQNAIQTFQLSDNDSAMGSFTISGVTGSSGDSNVDAVLSNNLTPIIHFTSANLANSYNVSIYANDGITQVCSPQSTTSTSLLLSGCILTAGTTYKASVQSVLNSSTQSATNNLFSFSVNRSPVAGSSPSGLGPWYVMSGSTININAAWAASPAIGVATDPDGDSLTFTAVGLGSLGTATNNSTYLSFVAGASTPGKETLSFTISDSRGGIFSGNVVIHVMTPTTWTGGISNTWTSSAGGNWCGSINLNKTGCSGGSVPTGSDTARIDDTCVGSNCTPSTNYNVSVGGIALAGSTLNQGTGFTLTIGSSKFAQSNGTFNGSNADINISNGFKLSGGTFNSTSTNLKIVASAVGLTVFDFTGGTFNHNNGSVTFDGTYNSFGAITENINIPNGITLYNLNYQSSNSCGYGPYMTWTIGTGQTMTVMNTFTQRNPTFGGCGSGYVTAMGGTILLMGDAVAGSGSNGGTTNLTFGSASNQTYTASSGSVFPRFIINKASGNVSADVSTTDLTIQQLQISSGVFNAPSGTLKIWINSGAGTALSITAGTFNHNSGTLAFDGTLNSFAGIPELIHVPLGLTVYNLSYRASTSSGYYPTMQWTLGTGQSITVLNDFSQFSSGSSGSQAIGGTIYANNQLTVGPGSAGGTTILEVNGTGVQTYFSTGGYLSFVKVNKPLGSFNPDVGTTSISMQRFELQSGTFTAPSGTMKIYKDAGPNQIAFTYSGGTFVHNNGTLTFDGTYNTYSPMPQSIDVPLGLTLYNLTYSATTKSGYAPYMQWVLGTGQSIVVLNRFTQTGNGTGSSIATGGTIYLAGDLVVGAGAAGGTTIVELNGSSTQNYFSTGGILPYIKVNNSSGGVQPDAGTSSIAMNFLSLLSGSFTAPTGQLTLVAYDASRTILSITGGTYNHNNGTLNFTGTLSNYVANALYIDVPTGVNLYNLSYTAMPSSGYSPTMNWTLGAGQTLTVTNDLTISSPAGCYTKASVGTININGNLNIGIGSSGGTSSVVLNSTGNQSINHSGGTIPGTTFTINKSSGTVYLNNNTSLSATNQDLSILAGTLDMNGFNLTVNRNISNLGTLVRGANPSCGTLSYGGSYTGSAHTCP